MSERTHIPIPRSVSKVKSRRKIKPVSAKRVKINRIYSALRKKFLETHPYCQWWLMENRLPEFQGASFWNDCPKSTDIHHKKGRGKYLLDTSTWMSVSREGHNWIHSHVKESHEKGYMLPRN